MVGIADHASRLDRAHPVRRKRSLARAPRQRVDRRKFFHEPGTDIKGRPTKRDRRLMANRAQTVIKEISI